MAESRRVFSAGRMNKDLDERLVPQGEYRDATNIEISTSEESNSGVVQNTLGNTRRTTMANFESQVTGVYDLTGGLETNSATCVCSVAASNEDKIYYFVNSDLNTVTGVELDRGKDYILQYDTVTQTIKYVFVDIFRVNATVAAAVNNATSFFIEEYSSGATNIPGIRVGMNLLFGTTYNANESQVKVTAVSYDVGESKWQITVDTAVTLAEDANIRFTAEKVLEFNKDNIITGVNILDDFIFWTDNVHEPKKINIRRSMFGTGGTEVLQGAGSNNPTSDIFEGENADFHTRLVIDSTETGQDFEVALNSAGTQPFFVGLSNVTVIRQAPKTPLLLDMYRTTADRVNTITGIENPVTAICSDGDFTEDGNPTLIGEETTITFEEPVDFREGDVLLFALSSSAYNSNYDEALQDVRALVVNSPGNDDNPNAIFTGPFTVEVLSIKTSVTSDMGSDLNPWKVRLEDKDTLFNFKFPRFSYRYKYQDGEYSPFAPFSQVAFLPGPFDYQAKKGHNLGMRNQLRGLKLKNYKDVETTCPQDVVEIDLLYKETNNPTVYTVKTIRKSDGHPMWPDVNIEPNARGEFNLTTDMIHAVVPSNQLIRPYDNVPRKALAQEITANRLVYGNYLQNYNVDSSPKLQLSFKHDEVLAGSNTHPLPSVKTMRDYHVGVVFSDRFGRETPVLTSETSVKRLDKKYSRFSNKLRAKIQTGTTIPEWAEYYSYYIKETSVEYYTLSMDRWYNASDGNIWLSFPSSERNKLKEEDFLILKKAHGSSTIVEEKAKYRILAIESNAPDFIKTQKISLGKVTDEGGAIGSAGQGFPLPEYRTVSIAQANFEEEFGTDFLRDRDYERLFIRVWAGNSQKSAYYEVSNIGLTSEGGFYRINVKQPFGQDMAFTSTQNSFATAIDGLQIELINYAVVNSPEFDGRFFVKIFKDDVLTQYVAQVSDLDYYVLNSWSLGYVNNNGYVNAGTRHLSSAYNGTDTPGGIQGTIPHNAIYPYARFHNGGYPSNWLPTDGLGVNWTHIDTVNPNLLTGNPIVDKFHWYRHYAANKFSTGPNHPTEHDWSTVQGYNADSYDTGAPYTFLKNHTEGEINNVRINMATNTVRAINGSESRDWFGSTQTGSDFQNPAKHFWWYVRSKNSFFIDGATAASWGGQNGGAPGNFFTPNAGSQYGLGSFSPGSGTAGGAASEDGFIQHHQYSSVNSAGTVQGNFYRYIVSGNWFSGDTDAGFFNASHANIANVWPSLGAGGTSHFSPYSADSGGENPQGNGQNNQIGNWSRYEGQPSRGIWSYQGKCFMDISWCSWPTQSGNTWEVSEGTTGLKRKLDEFADIDTQSAAAYAFIKELVTPGTVFRFQRCPDAQIYTVKGYENGVYDFDYDGEGFQNIGNEVGYANQNLGPGPKINGIWGIQNVLSCFFHDSGSGGEEKHDEAARQYAAAINHRQRWTIQVEPPIGGDETESGYNPIHGTDPDLVPIANDDGTLNPKFRRALQHDGQSNKSGHDVIEILSPFASDESSYSDSPAIWETEPREAVELDIYYQASGLIPLKLNEKTRPEYIPVGSTFTVTSYVLQPFDFGEESVTGGGQTIFETVVSTHTITSFENSTITFTPAITGQPVASIIAAGQEVSFQNVTINVTGHSIVTSIAPNVNTGATSGIISTTNIANKTVQLDWNNCWSFANGVESDRIRDDFNAPQMDNGVKASSTLASPRVKEERRKYGLIYSGVYNSNARVNDTNQFIAGENITKEINPTHGSIQALKARDTRAIIFCEDKILRADTNRDLLFNADGDSQVVASNSVIGSAVAYQGDYGISKNPESLVVTPTEMYFSDVSRGKVIALNDNSGARPISDAGMKDYFADKFAETVDKVIGTYDQRKNEYNISISTKTRNGQNLPTEQVTVSYSEKSKGWLSFKTFYVTQDLSPAQVKGLQHGISLNNQYYTFFDGHIWQHHTNQTRNNFYGTQYNSDITVLFNDAVESVKSFGYLSYEGSQARVTNWDDAATFADGVAFYNNNSATGSEATTGIVSVDNVSDREYYNIPDTVNGWFVSNLETNLQTCGELEFKDKEGKWFTYPTGETTTLSNLDEKEFSVQGLGIATMDHSDDSYGGPITITVNDSSTSAGGANWD